MDFGALIRQHGLVDIITVDDTNYAISAQPIVVPGCVVVLVHQLPNHLSVFLRTGYSHRYKSSYSVAAGLKHWVLFSYSLNELAPTNKQQFSHALSGSGGRKGLLVRWSGEKVGRCAFLVGKEHEAEAIAFFNHWSVAYRSEVLLRGN